MPFFIIKRVRSQDEELTLVDRRSFSSRASAETAAQRHPAARGLIVQVAIVEAASPADALRRAPDTSVAGSAADGSLDSQSH